MDQYSGVKSGLPADAETLWSQSYEILNRWKDVRSGKAMSLLKIGETLGPTWDDDDDDDEEAGDEYFKVSTLVSKVDGLKEDQAQKILESAQAWVDGGGGSWVDNSNAETSSRIKEISESMFTLES